MGPLSFREFARNSRFVLRIHDRYIILFAISQIFSQNHCKFSISFVNSPYFLRNVIREFTMDQFSFSRILNVSRKHFEFTICFAKTLWIHYLFREFTINPLFFRVFTLTLPSVSRIYYQLTINFAKNHDFTIYSANSPWIDYFY